jgi:hypothetical protein
LASGKRARVQLGAGLFGGIRQECRRLCHTKLQD